MNGMLRVIRRGFEKPHIAASVMVVAVVLALIKARAEGED